MYSSGSAFARILWSVRQACSSGSARAPALYRLGGARGRGEAMSTTAPQAAEQAREPATSVGTVHVFDPHPLNWLFITWNTMEEPVRTDHEGHLVLALAEDAGWRDDGSFAVTVRAGAWFQDGERCTAQSIKQNFDEVQRWA